MIWLQLATLVCTSILMCMVYLDRKEWWTPSQLKVRVPLMILAILLQVVGIWLEWRKSHRRRQPM